MENQPTKLNRIVKISIIILAVFLAVFVFYIGYKKFESVKKQTANSASEMQSKLDEQQTKIDELQEFKSEQQQQASKEAENLTKSQEIEACQKMKDACKNKIYEIENGDMNNIYHSGTIMTGNRQVAINKLEEYIKNQKKAAKEADGDEDHVKMFLKNADGAEKDVEKIKTLMASEAVEKSNLLAVECKNYQNPCE